MPLSSPTEVDTRGIEMVQQTLLVIDFHNPNAVKSVLQTVNSFENSPNFCTNVLVWNSSNTNDVQLVSTDDDKLQVVHSERRFLNSGEESKKVVTKKTVDCVIVTDDSLQLGPDQVCTLRTKFHEYDSDAVLCSQGFRIFPHTPFTDTREFWQSGRYLKFHDHDADDREVHLFRLNRGCCLFPVQFLLKMLTPEFLFPETNEWRYIEDFRASLTVEKKLMSHIWKVQLSLPEHSATLMQDSLAFSKEELCELDELYSVMKDRDLPLNTFAPIVSKDGVKPREKSTIWSEGFHGLNMSAEPVHLDFNAARAFGASVVRFGATNDAKDLKFIVEDLEDGTSETDRAHLKTMLPRLINAVKGAGESGLKVILTLCDLPGRRFKDSDDDRMWRSTESRQRIADLWGAIAGGLQDFRDIIIGYDIINEPFTPDDNECSFFCPMPNSFTIELHDLYERAQKAIRAVDKETMLILESSFWASPRTLPLLLPLDDPYVVYSFHFYAPSIYTFRHENDGRYTYPGRIPKWKKHTWEDEWPLWDENRIQKLVKPVAKWQKENGIPSSRIFVGEFGVSREVPGSENYLLDLMKIWEEFGWNWCLFSFRDNEWDAMDYELGEDQTNQLIRSQTKLFERISKHLS